MNVAGSFVGNLAFTGPGAGKEPTGNAVVADIISAATKSAMPLLKRGAKALALVKGRYLVEGKLPADVTEREEGGFTLTKEIQRDALLELIDKDIFFARIESKTL